MPPSPQPPTNTDHMLPRPFEASREGGSPHQKKSAGPLVGTIIVVILLVAGALYFWGAQLNKQAAPNQVSYIPAGTTTITITQ